MSAGSKGFFLRIPDDELAEIRAAIKSRNAVSVEAPWSEIDFVRASYRRWLQHLRRAREQTRRKRKARAAAAVGVPAAP